MLSESSLAFKNMKKQFEKNLAGFVAFYFALCLISVYSNIDPRFHLVSIYKKHFYISNEKCCFL